MKPDAERESKIHVFKCGSKKTNLCAKIAWIKEPLDSKGKPLHDVRNENPSMRGRPIMGLAIFSQLAPSAPSTWTGKIYNPEDGHTYSATLTVVSRKQILLKGCKAWLLCGERNVVPHVSAAGRSHSGGARGRNAADRGVGNAADRSRLRRLVLTPRLPRRKLPRAPRRRSRKPRSMLLRHNRRCRR